jgi:hypothetical protein
VDCDPRGEIGTSPWLKALQRKLTIWEPRLEWCGGEGKTAQARPHAGVADPNPDPPDPHVFEPPGSGSISQRYGSGSFYHHAKIVRKTLVPIIL